MKRSLYIAAGFLTCLVLFPWMTATAFARDQVPPSPTAQRGSLVVGNSDVNAVVNTFPAPSSYKLNVPKSFNVAMTIGNAGPDADQIVIARTLEVPSGCTGSLVGTITVTGADTAVAFDGLPVLAPSSTVPSNETVSLTCQSTGFHTFTFRVEVQPLYNDDTSQSDNLVTRAFTICDVTNPGDDADGDGVTNGAEEIAGTNPCSADTDGDGVGDGTDNCATVPNPGQENTDSGPPPPSFNTGGIGNGPGLAGDDGTVPNGDSLGDACDPDRDNDGLPNSDDGAVLTGCGAFNGEAAAHPNPAFGDVTYNDNNDLVMLGAGDNGPSWDTDGDSVRDGVECALGTNPRVANAGDLTTCRTFYGSGDTDADGIDNGAEVCKWGTDPTKVDTDSDGLSDCREIMDVNGNKLVNLADSTFVLQAFFGLIGKDGDFDVNGNGLINVADSTFIKQAFFGLLPCP